MILVYIWIINKLDRNSKDIVYNIAEVQNQFVEYVEKGCLDKSIIESLWLGSQFVPKEGWMWDYKSAMPSDRKSLCKLLLHISAFHNSFGGYIIYGIEEVVEDKKWVPCSKVNIELDVSQIRNLCKEYLSELVDVSIRELEMVLSESKYHFMLLYIPKRKYAESPVKTRKQGPDQKPRKPLFLPDETYYRRLDECVKAETGEDYQLILGKREELLSASIVVADILDDAILIDHNLPDKNQICPEFYGREAEISALWEWLTNPFEYTKLLAGDGGKGKTSIALEFCMQFAKNPPQGFVRILWLSAKTKQFIPLENDYLNIGYGDFSSTTSLLVNLCEQCGFFSEEFEGVSVPQLIGDTKGALHEFPSLIVVDDIDSLDDEEQQKIVDACRIIGEPRTRFLITSRKSVMFASDSCIIVPGLDKKAFRTYVDSVLGKYKLNSTNARQIENLYKAVDGSPLLAQSIIRLHNLGEPLQQAIHKWKGNLGEDARNAALLKEINEISIGGKRILVALSVLHESSATELKQAVGMEDVEFSDSVQELRKLFLMDEPRITPTEHRFALSMTTSLIVRAKATNLITDFNSIVKKVKTLRSDVLSTAKQGNKKKVSQAVAQATAFIRESDYVSALETLDAELAKQSNQPILLGVKGKCLIQRVPPNYDLARKLLVLAVDHGNSHSTTFEHWYKAEQELDSLAGMLECANRAICIKNRELDISRWHYRRAHCLRKRWESRNHKVEISDLIESSKALAHSIKLSTGPTSQIRIQESVELHDFIWSQSERGEVSWLAVFDTVRDLIDNGDKRTVMFQRAKRALYEFKCESRHSGRAVEAYKIRLKGFHHLINSRPDRDREERPFSELTNDLYPIPDVTTE